MSAERFVSTESALVLGKWKKPPHVLRVIKGVKRRAALRRASYRNCGTGGGGFQPGNECAKGDGTGGDDEGAGKSGLSEWRESNSASLDKLRSALADDAKLADDLIAEQRSLRAAAQTRLEEARELNDELKDKQKEASIRLRDALVAAATTPEEKERWSKENWILVHSNVRPKHLADESVRAAYNEVGGLKVQRDNALNQILKEELESTAAAEFEQKIRADAAKEAWAKLSSHAKEFATSGKNDESQTYSPEQYDRRLKNFSDAVASVYIQDNAGAKEAFTEATKKGVDEFLTATVSPVSSAALAIGASSLVLDKSVSREFCRNNEVHLNPSSTASTYAHELGHVMEKEPTIREAAVAFHESRCKPDDEVSLADKYPDYGYSPSEKGNADDFTKAMEAVYGSDYFADPGARAHYTGKLYRDSDGEVRATEVVSMGVQMMHDNPVAFAKSDPEYFDFILCIMAGGERRLVRKRRRK